MLLLSVSFGSFAQTQAELNIKAGNEFKKADAELNKVYKTLMLKLNAKDKSLLIAAQRNWLKFRDSHCGFETNQYKGGSILPMVYSSCLTQTTRKRIADLKSSIESRSR